MNEAKQVAIVLLNYNGQSLLQQFIPYLLKTSYPHTSIVVIDNASTDDSISFLEKNYPGIRIIRNDTNMGFAGGYNQGLRQIQADYYVLLNTDVMVSPGFVEPMLALLEGDPSIKICQPKILSLENPGIFEYAGAGGGYMDKLGYTFARGRILDTAEKDHDQYNQDVEIFWASGACMMIDAHWFHKLNGFYEYYFMYAEEVDLCWRTQLAGMKIFFCHSSVIFHKETTRFIDQSAHRIYHVFRNNLILLLRNLKGSEKVWIIPARILLNLAAAFLFLVKGHFKKSALVVKSIFAALYWSAFVKKQSIGHKRRLNAFKTIYKKSILLDYYFRKKKTFSELGIMNSEL